MSRFHTPASLSSPRGSRPAGDWGLLAAIAAADVGVKLSYMPLFSILLPAKAQALDGASAPFLLSVTSLAGAALASVVNIVVGWSGDRAPARSRAHALAGGAAAICGAYGLLALANSSVSLFAAVLVLQVAVNVTISPLTALVADRFFRRPAGFVVGAGGASQPAAGFLGAALTGLLLPFGSAAYLAVGAVAAAMILPFARIVARETRPGPPAARPDPGSSAAPTVAALAAADLGTPNELARLWIWRFSLALAGALSAPYALFRLREVLGDRSAAGLLALTLDISALTLLSSCAHLVAAMATARAVAQGLHRRHAAGLSALVMGAAMVAFVCCRGGGGFVLAFGLAGVGAGVSQVADSQLALALLPSRATLGRDLGFLNLANTAPQMLAPMLALLMPGVRSGHVGPLFALAAVSSVVGLGVAGRMSGTRRAGTERR